jgi:hypothetical protein
MTLLTKPLVVGLLMIAKSLQVTGDALVRIGLGQDVVAVIDRRFFGRQ